MNRYYVTVVDWLKVAPLKIQQTVAVNFSNSTCTEIFYNSQTSIGGRQYIIILFISIMFLHTLNYLNDRDRGRHYLL